MPTISPDMLTSASQLTNWLDYVRIEVSQRLDPLERSERGQFFTPQKIAGFMASLYRSHSGTLSILDAGAGIGSLSLALVSQILEWDDKPTTINLTAYEVDCYLIPRLTETLECCRMICMRHHISLVYQVFNEDFLLAATDILGNSFFLSDRIKSFDLVILNPPYKKINSASSIKTLLSKFDIDTTNLYTAFMWLSIALLKPNGQIVAITPRSYCNGPYYLPFRRYLLQHMSLDRVHVFNERSVVFGDDEILQENVVLYATKTNQSKIVGVSHGDEPENAEVIMHSVDRLIKPSDKQLFIHLPNHSYPCEILNLHEVLHNRLSDINVMVSSGRVVDFRAIDFLKQSVEHNDAPLIYPHHLREGKVHWSLGATKKKEVIAVSKQAASLLIPNGFYVLVKRFTSKEELKRVSAALLDPADLNFETIGIENHLNYYHNNGAGLSRNLAMGLVAYLNSSVVDNYFREFSGHTQVNATDLRNIPYPNHTQLEQIGAQIQGHFPNQYMLDCIILEALNINMANKKVNEVKINEAISILEALNIPKAQVNQRSALTLLALLGLTKDNLWSDATPSLLGITEMMNYFETHFGVRYAPNTRETVRRFTIHQFIQMGIVEANPDDPSRPINSPNNKYVVSTEFLNLAKAFNTVVWNNSLKEYLDKATKLDKLTPRERHMNRISAKLPTGEDIDLTSGGQNILIKSIVEEFCTRFTPNGIVIYIGDAGDKGKVTSPLLSELGVILNEHGKLPDVIVYLQAKNWLVLIEAVTSHGAIDIKRHNELKMLFANSTAPLVYVTAFPNRKVMTKYLQEIAWETEVWVAESPTHLIHFNGERFLGPY